MSRCSPGERVVNLLLLDATFTLCLLHQPPVVLLLRFGRHDEGHGICQFFGALYSELAGLRSKVAIIGVHIFFNCSCCKVEPCAQLDYCSHSFSEDDITHTQSPESLSTFATLTPASPGRRHGNDR